MTLVEICADDPGGEVQAEQGGAGRVELCAVAASGGVTPSIGTVEQALEHTGLPVTFHRAFDDCPDLPAALADLVAAKVRRVLTPGGPGRAHDHVPELRALVSAAGHDLEILAGGGVRSDHVAQLVAATGVSQVHLRAQAPSSRGYARTSAGLVAELVGALRGMPVKH